MILSRVVHLDTRSLLLTHWKCSSYRRDAYVDSELINAATWQSNHSLFRHAHDRRIWRCCAGRDLLGNGQLQLFLNLRVKLPLG